MIKETMFCGLAVLLALNNLTQIAVGQAHRNVEFAKPVLLRDNKKPNNVCCYCADGSTYSYANDCISGSNSCETNACPAAPEGCGGGNSGG